MPKGKGHDVICPGCRESYHETTDSYNPNKDANAGMLKLKDEYISYGWDQPPPDPTAGYGLLECPQCLAPLAPSGRLEVRERENQDTVDEPMVFKCPDCPNEYDSIQALNAHRRVHKK